jgi:hypothetical protein
MFRKMSHSDIVAQKLLSDIVARNLLNDIVARTLLRDIVARKLLSDIVARMLLILCAGLRKCRVILSLHHHLLVQLKLKFIQHASEFSSAITLVSNVYILNLANLFLQKLKILRNL